MEQFPSLSCADFFAQLDECMTFLLAGHETTAILLTWTIYLVTKHPEYCERAREEVRLTFVSKAFDWIPFDFKIGELPVSESKSSLFDPGCQRFRPAFHFTT